MIELGPAPSLLIRQKIFCKNAGGKLRDHCSSAGWCISVKKETKPFKASGFPRYWYFEPYVLQQLDPFPACWSSHNFEESSIAQCLLPLYEELILVCNCNTPKNSVDKNHESIKRLKSEQGILDMD